MDKELLWELDLQKCVTYVNDFYHNQHDVNHSWSYAWFQEAKKAARMIRQLARQRQKNVASRC